MKLVGSDIFGLQDPGSLNEVAYKLWAGLDSLL